MSAKHKELKPWHSFSLEKVFFDLRARSGGLTSREVEERVKRFGVNTLPEEKKYSALKLFISQFNSPLMYILLVTVCISFALKHYSDAIFIIVVLFINTTVGFYQESKANKSLSILKKMMRIRAKVLRDGSEKEIDSEGLVPGDIIMLKAGDKVPADARIIEAKNLRVNEASLTGEWLATEKFPGDATEDDSLAKRSNMAFMSTIVEEGSGVAIITGIGSRTQIGDVVTLLRETEERKTPLQKKIAGLSKILGAFVMGMIVVILVMGILRGEPFSEIFVAALALAVSAIPAGILPAITVILVLGMRRILSNKGLVRKLIANETLGSVTVICTDKTGTLTEGVMRVSQILTSTRELMEDGINDAVNKRDANGLESHISALKIAMMVTDAFIENPDDDLEKWIVRGSSTSKALLLAGTQAGLVKKNIELQYPLIDRLDFNSDTKYAATLRKNPNDNSNELSITGAPEIVIANSDYLDIDGKREKITTENSEKLLKKLEELTSRGLRVVACARKYCREGEEKDHKDLTGLAKELTLVGFIAIKDPLRSDIKDTISVTKKAGIKTVIITGDHKLTARAIAKEMGLNSKEMHILEGTELDNISDKDLKEMAKYISIYARVSPRHKLRIVKALQDNGEVVAMVGDGVNDAPAIKAADIGLAVGSGTDVAKEAADLVLLDDSFKTIIKAVEQGRVIFANIRKIFVYLVADDFSEIFLFFAAMAMGMPVPLLPAQILWINLVEDGFPDIALTTEQETTGVMEEKPRGPKEPILNKFIKMWMVSIFVITGLAAFGLYFVLYKITGDIDKTRTVVFALMALDSLVFSFSVRSFKRSIFRKDIFSNRYLVAAVGFGLALLIVSVYVPIFQKLLSTQSIHLSYWGLILSISAIEIILIEFTKRKIFGFISPKVNQGNH